MKTTSCAPVMGLLVTTALVVSDVTAAGYVMPMELARHFSQSPRLRERTPDQIAERFTPQIQEYFETQVPVYRHCRKPSLVDREFHGSVALCSAYNYYYDRVTAQYGHVPADPYSGPNPSPDAFPGVPQGGSESWSIGGGTSPDGH